MRPLGLLGGMLAAAAIALAATHYRVDGYTVGLNGITTNKNAAGVKAAYTELLGAMEVGEVAAACRQAVTDRTACRRDLSLMRLAPAEWAALRTSIGQIEVTVKGDRATWTYEGKREEAVYSEDRWLFTFGSGSE